ncbi:hypothetical protein [Dyella acidisoli]|uniref:Lipoprotein n=1 Tax=Dyella acidisoli TaxID=1867834 RepID=A0ABQ5XN10_9GAMM|nr:hypothetical protein [Dyella acidisoli]GLQ92559.1 hypothetical protein GCM10007901_15100 [Dyella acidisoli]
MRVMVRIALIVTLVLDLAGCYRIIKMPDIATASVYGPQVSGGSLSPQEVARLSTWMKAHDAGWRGLMGTPPAPIALAIVMRDPSGGQTTLNLFESKDGTATAYFYAPNPASPLERYLSKADVAALRAAVEN